MPHLQQQLQSSLTGYTIERELESGGMSRVFVATDLALGRKVVIKVLAPELVADMNSERFRRETLLAAQLQHPHIVPVLSSGIAAGVPYFVMPFVAGESLRRRLRQSEGIPMSAVISVLRDVAKALGFAHSHGVIHRDIKPDNVLLAGDSAVVTDFGIAKAITSALVVAPGATLTQMGTSLGTPAYMSPEQAAGDPNADARADFYSFGVMAYEMVSGKPPFHDRPAHALVMAHIAELPEPIERLTPGIPQPLAGLIMQCLAKNPADRPASAKEILDRLDESERWEYRTPRTDAHGTVLRQSNIPPKRARSRKVLWIGLAAGVALVTAGVVGWNSRRAGGGTKLDETAIAVVPFRIASADPSLHYLREGMVDLIAAKLSGEELRALEPRTLLDAWRGAGGGETADLTRPATLKLAQQLGAGRVLLGDVVGTPNHLVLNASLLSVPDGKQLARVNVEGPPDSLGSLVNQIAVQLLTQTSSEGAARLTTLAGTPLPALRAYLDGQSRLRRGEAVPAAKDFERALREDSTFALAGLGLKLATGWYGDPVLGDRGLHLAWVSRGKLSQRDQLQLEALAGTHYPAPSSTLEIFQARERFLSAASDNPEAWYLVADQVFHFGRALGILDWEERSAAGFRKAMDLDSTYLPGYTHATPLALSVGDTAFFRRAIALRRPTDTSTVWRTITDWYSAIRTGNTDVADSIGAVMEKSANLYAPQVVQHTLFDGTGAVYSRRLIDLYVTSFPTDAGKRNAARFGHDAMLSLGRSADATRLMEASVERPHDENVAIVAVRDALMGHPSLAAGEPAAKQLQTVEGGTDPTDSTARVARRGVIRVMETWRLVHGDTTLTARSLQRLRATLPYAPAGDGPNAQVEIALIEAMHADVTRSPRLRAAVERLDSLQANLDFSNTTGSRVAQTAVTTARLWEKLNEPRKALIAAGRTTAWWTQAVPYITDQLRDEARLAAKVGERKRARRSYEIYLAMTADADNALKPQIDSVKREFAALGTR